jgi:DNA-binding GntR family transcriptional regulator
MKLKHHSLAEQVYQRLLKDIISGKLKAGEKLSEETVCEHFGVSRTPAREAMLMLNRDGLVERIPRRGCFVKKFDATEVDELSQCRKMLECMALEQGLEFIPDSELRKLESTIDNAEDKSKVKNSLAVDEKLHELIAHACPNRYLGELVRQLIKRTRPFRLWRSYGVENIEPISQERKKIIRAIRKKDKDLAVKLLGEHICSGKYASENTG